MTIAVRCQGDLFDTMREDRDAACLDLQRRNVFTRLLVFPGVHDRPANDQNPHTFLEQFSKALGILMPPLNVAPEAPTILVATLAIGDRVVEHHIESQHVPRIFVAVGERTVFSCVTDVAFPNYWCTHGVSPFSVEVGS